MARDKYGIYRGVVTDVRDPKKLDRVRVRIPQVLGQATSTWADFTTAPQRKPRVGDRVFVQFVGGDTRYPVWRQVVSTKDVGVFEDLTVTGTATINNLLVTGTTAIDGPLDVTGAAAIDGTLVVQGIADFYDTVVFHDNTFFDFPAVFNSTLRVEGNATFNNPTTFTEMVNINGGVTFAGGFVAPGVTSNGDLVVNGGTDLNGGLDVLGGATVGGAINANGGINLPAGQWVRRGAISGLGGYANGWGNFDNATYIEHPDRTASLSGRVSTGTVSTTGTNVQIANLPGAVRPGFTQIFLCAAESGNYTTIEIQPDGNVMQRRASAAGIAWVSLSGCRWPMNGF